MVDVVLQIEVDGGGGAGAAGGELQPVADEAARPGDMAGHLGHADHPVVQLYLKAGQQGGLDVPHDLLRSPGLVGEDVNFADRAILQAEFSAQDARELGNQLFPCRYIGRALRFYGHGSASIRSEYPPAGGMVWDHSAC